MERIVLDALQMGERKQAHEYLKEVLSLPDYYGFNLDALQDCLTELNGVEIRFINEKKAGPYFRKIKKVVTENASGYTF